MATPPAELPVTDQLATPSGSSVRGKRQRWFELCLVLFISFGGSLYNGIYYLNHSPSAVPVITTARALYTATQSAVTIVLLGYVLARTGRKFRDIGLRWSFRDVGVGIVVLIVAFVVLFAVSTESLAIHFTIYGTVPVHHRASEFFGHFRLAMLPYFLIAPVHEELIVRAYLMTEIRELTGSVTLAGAASLVLQFTYHLYYGWWGALTVTGMFLVYTLYFARWRRALPIVVAHELYDIFAIFHL
jgi:membrane protease YdiL (CAAX protease family)